jgi:hypothetical protein
VGSDGLNASDCEYELCLCRKGQLKECSLMLLIL